MDEKKYTYKELADMFGLGSKPFKDLMIEMGLLDKRGRATKFALKNGFLVDRSALHKDKHVNSS